MNTVLNFQTGKELIEAVKNKTIGVLQHNLSLVIGTHVVKSLFIGSEEGPIGLLKFAKMAKAISDAANAGDTTAIKHLLKLDNMISKTRKTIKTMLRQVNATQPETVGIIIDSPSNEKPLTIRLQFNTEYAYLMAFLLAECDQLIHMLVRQGEVGFSPRHEIARQIRLIRYQIRRVLSFPVQWQNMNIIQTDIAINNESIN